MNIRIRRTTDEDIDFVCIAEKTQDNSLYVGTWTKEQHINAIKDNNVAHFIIESKQKNKSVGYIILNNIKNENRTIEFMRIVVTEKNKGYGQNAIKAIVEYVFTELKAHRLWLDVKEHNIRARTIYEKVGFKYEGLLRECIKTSNGYESLVIMSMLESDYSNKIKSFIK